MCFGLLLISGLILLFWLSILIKFYDEGTIHLSGNHRPLNYFCYHRLPPSMSALCWVRINAWYDRLGDINGEECSGIYEEKKRENFLKHQGWKINEKTQETRK